MLIADAAQNGLGKVYESVTEGPVLVMTFVAWELIDWAQYRFPALRPTLIAPPLTIIEDGGLVRAIAEREMLTEDELHSQRREKEVLHFEESSSPSSKATDA